MATDTTLQRQARWLESYSPRLRVSEQGRVVSVGDGIAWIDGLPTAAMDELLDLEDGSRALVFHLKTDRLGAILLYQTERLTAGTRVALTGRRLELPVGDALLGRVIDPLGAPLDGEVPPRCDRWRPLDAPAPPIVDRTFVDRPLYTGNKIIDTMIPIGKGQRQLLIGDNGVGKSALAIDAVINQRGKNVKCVYVLVGQKRSTVVNTIDVLRAHGAMEHTTVLVAEATALPGLKYLAPFAGCAVAESWMQFGEDTLVIYDDITTHAQTYRELSLLLQRPPGREAYPGDIFYLHSRLLERATCLAPTAGGGSMTALPIVETMQGEIASYIPTNLISITDGQVYLDKELFDSGVLPAIDVTRSVSRIGGNAQHPLIKQEAGRTKLDYLQFLELEVFVRFGTRLEPAMEKRIRRGRALREALKQDRLTPLPIEFQMAWLTAFNEGLLEEADAKRIPEKLQALGAGLARQPLTLQDERAAWVEAVKSWLGAAAP
ncbi:MAG TPA: F0F1 ATP synthase subunit alpha [Burkholderiales bacterium]|nr:F0F1 ATP synthase subunit alpha [Burkholderiales bacterium]